VRADFSGTSFQSGRAAFSGKVTFGDAEFGGLVNFNDAVFEQTARFTGARFTGPATFHGPAYFDDADFAELVRSGTTFAADAGSSGRPDTRGSASDRSSPAARSR
jgi:uncharacterized protein YjbI with pentapeptide repeats